MPNKKKKRTGCPMRNRRAPAKGCPAGFCGEKEGRRSGVRNVPARAGRFEQSAALPDAAPPARLEPTTIPSPEIVALHRGLLPAAHRSVSGPTSASLHRPPGSDQLRRSEQPPRAVLFVHPVLLCLTPSVLATVNAQGRWVFYKRKSAPVIRCAEEGPPRKTAPQDFAGKRRAGGAV